MCRGERITSEDQSVELRLPGVRPEKCCEGVAVTVSVGNCTFGELEAWDEHLRKLDITVESRIKWARGGTSLYFRDPDGHSLEVATPGLWPNH